MVTVAGDMSELAAARRQRLWETIVRLEDDELRARVEAPAAGGARRSIEEWHDLVEGLDVAIRAMRACRHIEARQQSAGISDRIAC